MLAALPRWPRIDAMSKAGRHRLALSNRSARLMLYAMFLFVGAMTVRQLADINCVRFQKNDLVLAAVPTAEPSIPLYNRAIDGDIGGFKCIGWRQTGECSSNGPREAENDKPCDAKIESGSGYCEIQHRGTGEKRRVLPLECSATRVPITCDSFVGLTNYGPDSLTYTHDAKFSFYGNRLRLIASNPQATAAIARHDNGTEDGYFARGIVMVVLERMLPSVYASIATMRALGCTLPVELFYIASETKPTHPILQALVDNHEVYLREITDPDATGYYTKLYAVFYSAFDQVLLMDQDNFATRDPTYLFFTDAYKATGAIFWPDFWFPDHTTFNVQKTSIAWQVFDVPFVDMFEQESGQVLINRRRHVKAMNVMMYYGFKKPRYPEEMQLVWGDKDLFRLAWMKTKSTFHMIERPPGSAGMLDAETNRFCGVTMAQHDPHNEIIFLHRNWEKLTDDNVRSAWTHVQQFKFHSPLKEYEIRYVPDMLPHWRGCWGKDENWEKHFTVTPWAEFFFHDVEPKVLRYAREAVAIQKAGKKQ